MESVEFVFKRKAPSLSSILTSTLVESHKVGSPIEEMEDLCFNKSQFCDIFRLLPLKKTNKPDAMLCMDYVDMFMYITNVESKTVDKVFVPKFSSPPFPSLGPDVRFIERVNRLRFENVYYPLDLIHQFYDKVRLVDITHFIPVFNSVDTSIAYYIMFGEDLLGYPWVFISDKIAFPNVVMRAFMVEEDAVNV